MKPYEQWVQQLNLIPHPEGGYFREIYRSEDKVLCNRFQGERHAATSIYYLLRSEDFSAFHRFNSDEIWHFYAGSSLSLYVLNPNGELETIILGQQNNSTQFQAIIKANRWFAACVNEPNSYALVGCTVSPGFEFNDFKLAERQTLIQRHPQHKKLITRLTRQ